MKKRCLFLLSTLTLASIAHADNRQGWYLGGGPGFVDTGVASGDGGTIGFSTLELYTGYKYSGLLGAELRLGTGISGDNGTVISDIDGESVSQDYEYDLTHSASFYYRAEAISPAAKIYALLGYSSVGLEGANDVVVLTNTSNGVSYGGGIGFFIEPKGNLNFEYRTLLSNENYKFEVLSISYDYRF